MGAVDRVAHIRQCRRAGDDHVVVGGARAHAILFIGSAAAIANSGFNLAEGVLTASAAMRHVGRVLPGRPCPRSSV
jgi:hypothetical protein